MRINSIKPVTTFKAEDDLEKYLSKISVTNRSELNGLQEINWNLKKDVLSRLYTKRTINEQKEMSKQNIFDSSLDKVESCIKEYSLRLSQSAHENLIGLTSYIDDPIIAQFLNLQYRHSKESLFIGTQEGQFKNEIKQFNYQSENLENMNENERLLELKKLFNEFRDNDSTSVTKNLEKLTTMSNKYFQQTNQDFQDIKDIKTTLKKWLERIPIAGLKPKIKRVREQQQATKYVYENYKDYHNEVILNGIEPIISSYIKKLNSIKKYMQLIAPKFTNHGNIIIKNFEDEFDNVAVATLKQYKQSLFSITLNGEDIANRCKTIVNEGDLNVALKALRSVITIGCA